MNTPLHYWASDEPVPYPSYRCRATAAEANRVGFTHLCRSHADHEGKHTCICGKDWEPVTGS